ncbi:GHKL domain-containing protein [bacterium]|nr:GHKL domain-containing protein [bacterium]
MIVLSSHLFAQNIDRTIQIDGKSVSYSLIPHDYSLKDQASDNLKFTKIESTVIDLGPRDSSVLIKFKLIKPFETNHYKLYSPIPYFDSISAYTKSRGELVKQISGKYISKERRSDKDPYPTFDIDFNGKDEIDVFIKVSTKTFYVVPLIIAEEESYSSFISIRNIFLGAFAGIMLCMLLYNLVLAFYTHDRNYWYYLGYILFIGLAQFSFLGIDYYLLGIRPVWSNHFMFLGSSFSGILGALFALNFLKIRERLKKIYYILYIILIFLYSIVAVTYFLGLLNISYQLIQLSGLYGAMVILLTSLLLSLKGVRSAKIYLLSWSLLIVGLIFYVMKDSGIIPTNNLSIFSLPIGIAVETILISVALADRINTLRKETDEAQERVIEELARNENLIKNQNVILEEKVKQRTEELEKTLEDLKKAQVKLIESEKMASLGVLTAGIAHEINNPINYVTANVIPLRENIEIISELLSRYKALPSVEDQESEMKKIEAYEDEIELDYTLKETDELIDGIEEGAKRTYNIVEGLRTFSRSDSGASQQANINKGLKSTLAILKNELNSIKVNLSLDENIPDIQCQLGKLNQVFLNLLNNAIHAVEDRHSSDISKAEIDVSSILEDDCIVIKVRDNGNGIPENIQSKVFEPFYTSKPVGKGTGLGLSISYAIIEDHNGVINFESKEGEGSLFRIELPITK